MTITETVTETKKFDAEIGKVLHLMIHSLYTNKDIFLRELISNGSDAIEKMRYLSVNNPELLEDDQDLKIKISIDENNKSITISDNGIGMDKSELIENLGTIAKSGTQNFLSQLSGDNKKDSQLIGQFGVGFYSSFMVASDVTVTTRKYNEKHAYCWQSNGDGEYQISNLEGNLPRGTSITLTIRDEDKEYLDKFKIKFIITTYSDHISFPIELADKEGEATIINSSSALWCKSKSTISDEEYQNFYKHVAHSPDEPWMTLHNKNEGSLEYTNLLFIPSLKPFDLYHPDRITRVKLYIKKVFIAESGVNIIPAYLRFIRGVIDSEDLPLNISRETLQHNNIIEKIKKSIINKVLSELKKRAKKDPADYLKFWENFGAVLKEGLCEGLDIKEQILEVCKFATTSESEITGLDDYISRMKEGQEFIYYLLGDDIDQAKNSPQLEGFKKKGIEVILLTDNVDDFWVNVVPEYKNIEFKSVTRAEINLDNMSKEEGKEEVITPKSDNIIAVLDFMKQALGEQVLDVKISGKLTDSPACLAVAEGAMDIRMERFLLEQKQLRNSSKKILEINENHPVIIGLANKIINQEDNNQNTDIAQIIFDQACIIEGEPLKNPNDFAKRITNIIAKIT
jgi:molecular chaperone HtpG